MPKIYYFSSNNPVPPNFHEIASDFASLTIWTNGIMVFGITIILIKPFLIKKIINRKFRKFSINYGFGSISPFDTPELIEMLRNFLLILTFQSLINN